ncbi:hypothetical protein [Pseudomonas huanghezhanensis]|uniref:hypothetical protein n=1 Tax=Pseudomonas huanghezhanensis TaxID=3002903 RepID=UPI002286B671|nr:hypothetical protein [Pseudomonas sp. BSw22131]
MQSTYHSRDFVEGAFKITVNAYRNGSATPWTIDVVTRKAGERISPVWREYNRSYFKLEAAQQAGLAGGRLMISSLH